MTKKDYIIVAKCMNEVHASALKILNASSENSETHVIALGQVMAITDIVHYMLDEFAKDNEKFDWKKFKEAVYK